VNEQAFLKEIRSHQQLIYKLVSLYAVNSEDRKDLCQEVLLQAWKAWPSFRGEARFSTWLYRICLNTLLTHRRKGSALQFVDSIEELAPAIPHQSQAREEALRLQLAIRRLPETDRALVALHLDGYSHAEIASIMGISSNHVAVKLFRCKEQLGTLLNVAV
jgi:RNA polymerase sigma factor (sigma-70 family)